MSTYALIENDTTLINMCEWNGVTPFDPGEGITLVPASSIPPNAHIGSTKNQDGTWSNPPAVVQVWGYTFLQFMALFTQAEQAAVIGSTDVNVKIFTTMAAGSGGLLLDNPDVVTGIDYLESVGLITSDRAAQILAGDTPPS